MILPLLLMAVSAGRAPAPHEDALRGEVRQAMLRTYFHGVDDDLAARVLPPGSVPILKELLADPLFPRRDNVVAFLAHTDRGAAVSSLLSFLGRPPASPEIPEEDRALMLAPQALGHIARRGGGAALEALLAMTEAGPPSSLLTSAASRGSHPASLRDDLVEAALRGLAFSRSPRARQRLADVATGRVPLESHARDLTRSAREALVLFDGAAAPGSGPPPAAGPPGSPIPPGRPAPVDALSGAIDPWDAGGGVSTQLADTGTRTAGGPLTYANHPAISSPMSDARLDVVLAESNLRVGRSDFTGDISCCAMVTRSGTALTFGSVNDGLDSIDNATELNTVLTNTVSRVKVVRAINYCGGSGTNIIGCAYVGGFGMSLVRMTDLGSEAVLWVHEYGHNTGLNHVTDTRGIMYGVDTGANNGLVQSECTSYHSPAPGAGQTVTDLGACTDADADSVQDLQDNCSSIYNFGQADNDGDHIGDVCDTDDDNDTVADVSDCLPLDAQVWAPPAEATDLTFASDPSGAVISWTAPSPPGGTAASPRYDTLQSTTPASFTSGVTCVESSDGPNTTASTALATPAWNGEGNLIGAVFGSAVSSAGDVNHDGFDDFLAGAPGHTNVQDGEGRFYIYYGTTSINVALSQPFESNNDFAALGSSVAHAGDVNGDGYADVIVGAPAYDNGLGPAGSVFVYYGSPSGIQNPPSWELHGDQSDAQLGASVAGAGDVNGDGYADVLIGAPNRDNGLAGEGEVFLYLGSASGLSPTPAWSVSGGQAFAKLGAALASAGDVNGDGKSDVVIGQPDWGNGQTNEGRVLVYTGTPAGLSASPIWTAEGDQDQARLGNAVGATDVNGDGYSDVIVGAELYDAGALTDCGRVAVHPGSATGPAAAPVWIGLGDQSDARYGSAVAGLPAAGKFNGDTFGDVVIGARGYDNGETDEGRVYIMIGWSLGVRAAPLLVVESNQAGALLGTSVASAGDVNGDGKVDMIAGANLYDNGQVNEGRASIWLGTQTLAPAPGAAFYYYVRAENGCGSGPLGFSSSGALRVGVTCP